MVENNIICETFYLPQINKVDSSSWHSSRYLTTKITFNRSSTDNIICDQLFFSTTDNIIYNRSLNNISSQDLCHKPIFSHTVYLCIDSPWSTVPIPAKIELHVLREVWKRGGSFLQSLSYHLYNSVFVVTTLTYKYPTICIVQIVGITETRGTIKLCGA
jgi:hypothetical protein